MPSSPIEILSSERVAGQENEGYEQELDQLTDIPPSTASRGNIKNTNPRFVQSVSIVSQSPPEYDDVSVQPPPTYKDLFPSIFRTFSRDDGMDDELVVPPSEHEATSIVGYRILPFVLGVCLVLIIVGLMIKHFAN